MFSKAQHAWEEDITLGHKLGTLTIHFPRNILFLLAEKKEKITHLSHINKKVEQPMHRARLFHTCK